MISIKFLLVISMLCKTEWSWELQAWSHMMNLLDISSTSHHYFCRKWIGTTKNEWMRIQILILGFKGLISYLTCARQPVRRASSVSHLTSPCNERTWNAKGTDTIMTSPEREAPKTSTKRSTTINNVFFAFPSPQFSARPKALQAPQDICRSISFGIHRENFWG